VSPDLQRAAARGGIADATVEASTGEHHELERADEGCATTAHRTQLNERGQCDGRSSLAQLTTDRVLSQDRQISGSAAVRGRNLTAPAEGGIKSEDTKREGAVMAVGIRQTITGVDAGDIDRLNAAIDPDGNPPEGLVFHVSGPVDGGWQVIDVWESREYFDRFAAERIMPGLAAIGMAGGGAPEMEEFAVHEHFPR
jgi:hypothetical protein